MNVDTDLHYTFLLEYAKEKALKNQKDKGIVTDDIKRKYVMYIRRSTKDRHHQEKSIEDQLKACNEYCKVNGIKPLEILIEEESAKRAGKRSIFSAMIENIRKEKYNSIIAYHPDRLARNMKDAGEILDLLDIGKLVDLKFPTFIFNRDSNGFLTLGLQFLMAKQYVDNLSTVSQRGTKSIVEEGKAPIYAKYGYVKSEDRYFRPDGKNFELIKQAFRMGIDGYSYEDVATFLNEHDFQFKGKKVKMYKQKISDIFSDPFFAGINVFGGTVVELVKKDPLFTPVITPLEFSKLRKVINSSKGYKAKQETITLLRGMVTCHYCQNQMTPALLGNGKGKYYLRLNCTNKQCARYTEKKADGTNIRRDMRGKIIFEKMYEILKGIQFDESAYADYVKDMKKIARKEKATYVENLATLDTRMSNIERDIESTASALGKTVEKKAIDLLNKKIEKLIHEKDLAEVRKENIEKQLVDIDYEMSQETLPYKKFSNFFENIAGIIRNNENAFIVDNAIRMIFSNFVVDDEKVLSYQYNPHIEKYLKVASVMSCRDGGT